MSGLNFVFSFDGSVGNHASDYEAATRDTLFIDGHHVDSLLESDQVLSSFTGYDGYPLRTFENEGVMFYVEGRIYNLDEDAVNKAIVSFSERLFQGDQSAKKDLTDWLLTVEGEFMVLAFSSAENKILIFNDVFGLLPTYIHQTDWGVVFSRNISFLAGMVEQKQFDKIAIAQFLMLKYTIGDRTHLKDVFRPRPAELITIDAKSKDVKREVLYAFNFDEKKFCNRSTKTNAAELAKLFIDGCRVRVDKDCKPVVFLSGGLDSRAVAAALKRVGVDFEARTALDVNGIASADFKVAEQVASELDIEWKPLDLNQLTGRNMLRILKMKCGLLDVGKDLMIQVSEKMLSESGGKAIPFIAIGGDRLLHDIRSVGSREIDSFRDFLRRTPAFMPFATVSKITGVSEKEFYEVIQKELNSYPEKTTTQKYVHFWYYGQTFKWLFEAHDRVRHYAWPVSPFFSTEFFRYVINCPDSQKTFLRFYYYFLNNLNPKMSSMPCARNLFLTPIPLERCRSLIWYWYCYACQTYRRVRKWPNPVRFVIKKIKKLTSKPSSGIKEKFEHSATLIKCMTEQISNCRQKVDFLNWTEIEDIVNKSEDYRSQVLIHVFTIISMAEQLTTGQSTLEKYQDTPFGSHKRILYKENPTENF